MVRYSTVVNMAKHSLILASASIKDRSPETGFEYRYGISGTKIADGPADFGLLSPTMLDFRI
jgi:hypothetical protein